MRTPELALFVGGPRHGDVILDEIRPVSVSDFDHTPKTETRVMDPELCEDFEKILEEEIARCRPA